MSEYVREQPWAKHYQHVWTERAGNVSLPHWLRVAAVAYGGHGPNGHCPLNPGDLAWALFHLDDGTGEVVPSSNTARAVEIAVRNGWLDQKSSARCLVVPAHAVSKENGNVNAPCPWHDRKRKKA